MASRRILALFAVLAIFGNGKHARSPHSLLTKLSPPATESRPDIFALRVSNSVTSLILNNFYKFEKLQYFLSHSISRMFDTNLLYFLTESPINFFCHAIFHRRINELSITIMSYVLQSVIDEVVDQWRIQLRAFVKAEAGHHFEHLLLCLFPS